jgi:hypothetical protein
MQDFMPRLPHPANNFFEQTVQQGQIGHDLPQGAGLGR